MWGRTQLKIEGISAYRAVDKLEKAGIPVFFVRKKQKNAITLEVESKDYKKVFAILQSPCYNVKKVRLRGLSKLYSLVRQSAGLVAGIFLFLALVLFFQSRVLKIEVVGSGAYYEAEVLQILSDSGVQTLSAPPKNTALATAQILSLPRVSYCSLKKSGGILTVEVEVSDENATLSGDNLLSPHAGVIAELIVIRGTAERAVGDEVNKGDVVVRNRALYGEEARSVLVIARVKIKFPVSEVFLGSEEEARSQAFLQYGEIEIERIEAAEGGYFIVGTAYAEANLNLE